MYVMCVCVYTHTAVQKICKSEFSSAFTPVCHERVHTTAVKWPMVPNHIFMGSPMYKYSNLSQ